VLPEVFSLPPKPVGTSSEAIADGETGPAPAPRETGRTPFAPPDLLHRPMTRKGA
jgi:hypothetical protein